MRRVFGDLFLVALLTSVAGSLWAEQPPPPPVTPPATPRPQTGMSAPPRRVTQEQLDAADAQFTGSANYDEVAHELLEQFLNFKITNQKAEVHASKLSYKEAREARAKEAKEAKEAKAAAKNAPAKPDEYSIADMDAYTVNAQDCARKLVSLGKRAVPETAELFRASYAKPEKAADALQTAQVTYYTAWVLSHIRLAEAAKPLIPLLTNTAARSDLRVIAVDAAGWEKLDEGVALLQKIAVIDPDTEVRKRAVGQLSMIPEHWVQSEPVFVRLLDDPNEDIRTQAVKACHYAHIFLSANPKLVQLIEKDESPVVRQYALLTLARLKVREAQPALIRMLAKIDLDEKIRKQALATLVSISGVPFRDVDGALSWWAKQGKEEFEAIEKRSGAEAAESNDAELLPMKPLPKFKAAPAEIADVVPLSDTKSKAAELLPEDVPAVAPTPFNSAKMPELTKDAPAVPRKVDGSESRPTVKAENAKASVVEPLPGTRFDDAPPENLDPNESTGSQRRKKRLAEQP